MGFKKGRGISDRSRLALDLYWILKFLRLASKGQNRGAYRPDNSGRLRLKPILIIVYVTGIIFS